jgi:PilZ domain
VRTPHDRRDAPRVRAVGHARLRALACRKLSAGAELDATVQDISAAAVGLDVDGPIVAGDRLHLEARFFGVELEVEVDVASARRPPGARSTAVGCRFAEGLRGDQRVALERIVLAREAQYDLGLGARFALGE